MIKYVSLERLSGVGGRVFDVLFVFEMVFDILGRIICAWGPNLVETTLERLESVPDRICEDGFHPCHENLESLDHPDYLNQSKLLVTWVIVPKNILILIIEGTYKANNAIKN